VLETFTLVSFVNVPGVIFLRGVVAGMPFCLACLANHIILMLKILIIGPTQNLPKAFGIIGEPAKFQWRA